MERAVESDAVEEDTYENIKKMLDFSSIFITLIGLFVLIY